MNGERRTFADNQRDNTIAAAILGFAEYNGHRWPISIASGYFNLGGFSMIAGALEAAPSVRILLGVEPHPPRATTSHADVRATREQQRLQLGALACAGRRQLDQPLSDQSLQRFDERIGGDRRLDQYARPAQDLGR